MLFNPTNIDIDRDGRIWVAEGVRYRQHHARQPEGDRIVKAKNACSLGESWFRNHTAERLYPEALIDGESATVDAAIEAAADYLYKADLPLVYGLSNITCEAQRESVALAELIGGVVDSHTSL